MFNAPADRYNDAALTGEGAVQVKKIGLVCCILNHPVEHELLTSRWFSLFFLLLLEYFFPLLPFQSHKLTHCTTPFSQKYQTFSLSFDCVLCHSFLQNHSSNATMKSFAL